MKTTVELPDLLFRKAKARAAERGQSLKDYLTDALRMKVRTDDEGVMTGEPRWMAGFGKLGRIRKETARIQILIDEAFEAVEPEDRA
jgi:hypothetical protein